MSWGAGRVAGALGSFPRRGDSRTNMPPRYSERAINLVEPALRASAVRHLAERHEPRHSVGHSTEPSVPRMASTKLCFCCRCRAMNP